MTARAPARDHDAERARARRPENRSTVSSRPSHCPAADRRTGRASWPRTTACGARRQAMVELLRRGGRDECDVSVSRPLPPLRMDRAVVARVEIRLVPVGCHGRVHGPALTFRVSQPRPETARVQSSPASRNPSAPIPLRGQQRSPRRAYSSTCAWEDIRRPTELVALYDIGALRPVRDERGDQHLVEGSQPNHPWPKATA